MPPRTVGTVLGLPIPDTPVNVDAPRASRTLKRPTNVDGSEDSSNSLNAPPRKVKKTTLGAAKEGGHIETRLAMSTGPVNTSEPTLAPEVPSKPRKTKKSATQVLASNVEGEALVTQSALDPTSHSTEPTPPTKALKKKGKKKAAVPGHADGDVEMSAPAPEVGVEPGSIIVGDSIVPSDPAKKKSHKAAPATTSGLDLTDTPNIAGRSTPADAVVGSGPGTAAGPGAGSRKGSSRVKTASALAQKVLEQETQKQLEKEAKAQRKREKTQKTVITESLEDTAAFVAAGDVSNGTSSTSNIEIRAPEVPVTTGGLQRVQQNSVNKLVAQRITQRLLASTPPASSTSTSGSEAPGAASSSRAPSTNYSHRASRTPSVSLPTSCSVSVAPSARSTPAPTFSGMSRVVSQPPTLPPSPATPTLLTLADHLHGIDVEFAPLLPAYNPLPAPLRLPERIKPVPRRDINKLSAAERREYIKECKFGVKDLTPVDQIIVSSVISRLEALILTVDCFP
ncbi:hypothetical protein FRC10_004726, partial [Ceratobasidium sp. 414]